MGVVQRFEQRLGGLVEGAFAKVFKGAVQPVELAGSLKREADTKRSVVDADRILTVNAFTISLGDSDFARLAEWAAPLSRELTAMLREHATEEHYSFVGPVTVSFDHDPQLPTGRFTITSALQPGDATAAGDRPPTPVPPRAASATAPHEVIYAATAQLAAPSPGATPGATPGVVPSALPARPIATGRPRLTNETGTVETAITKRTSVIGRTQDADIRIDDPGVSRRHAQIQVADDDIELVDAGSTNGSLVNGTNVSSARLRDGDRLTFGQTTLVFRRDRG